MPTKLTHIAQNAMDLYYQNERADEDYFELYHFMFLCQASYYAQLQEAWDKSYSNNVREGSFKADLPPDWFQPVQVNIEQVMGEYLTRLPVAPFSFKYDKNSGGIGLVRAGGKTCIRININELYKLRLAPFTTNVYCWVVGGGGQLAFTSSDLVPPAATVYYIPTIDLKDKDTTLIPDSMVDMMLKNVWQFMTQAKSGHPFVNMSNDQNPNVVPDAEIVTSLRRLMGVNPKE